MGVLGLFGFVVYGVPLLFCYLCADTLHFVRECWQDDPPEDFLANTPPKEGDTVEGEELTGLVTICQ